MANTKISALTANTNPTGLEELVYAYNNANGKMTLNTMKAFVGGAGITTLNADANIWELTDGIYESSYDLYYKSGEVVPALTVPSSFKKQMLFVVTTSEGSKGYFVFNGGSKSSASVYRGYASFGYSDSSSEGECYLLGDRAWALGQFEPTSMTADFDAITKNELTQIVNNAYGNCELRIASGHPTYPGVTYTLLVNSAKSGNNYSVTLGNGITNPLGITLPSSSTKKCVITILTTSETTGIVTGCTIEP